MKKSVLIVCVLVLVMSVFAGCGKSDDTDTKGEGGAGSSGSSSEIVESVGNSDVIENFVKETQTELDSANEAMKDSLEMSVSAENDKVTFTYKFMQDMGDDTALKSALDGVLQAQEASMGEAVKHLETLGIEKPVVELKILDKDGKEISSREYK